MRYFNKCFTIKIALLPRKKVGTVKNILLWYFAYRRARILKQQQHWNSICSNMRNKRNKSNNSNRSSRGNKGIATTSIAIEGVIGGT